MEIIQPTIFDIESFALWKNEAFSLWKNYWQKYYTIGSESYNILEEIYNNYYLTVVIDNNYKNISFIDIYNFLI